MSRVLRVALALAAGIGIASVVGCKMRDDDGQGAAHAPAERGQLRFIAPPPGEVPAAVLAQRAKEPERVVLVYAGAPWCEPCQRFHAAAQRGELDADLPNVTLLEYDVEEDRGRLLGAGYQSKFIPLFALPGADGRASGRFEEGSVKGDGAVRDLTPRLKRLIEG